MLFTGKWMKVETNILSKLNKSQKEKSWGIFLVGGP